MRRSLFLVLICLSVSGTASAQQNLFYNHYFLNPYLYNPSFIAPNGYSEVYLNYRKQWIGFEGAPTTGTVSVHLPLSYKAGFAISGYQDEAGVLKTTTGLLSFAYQVYLGKRVSDIHKISFGMSAGLTTSTIDADKVDNPNDPVVGSTSSFDGQFGIHYQFKNLKLAFAIPRIFQTYVVSENDFNKAGIEQVKNTISSISYNIKLNDRFSFEPYVTYRTYENIDAQYEAMGVFRIDNIGWLGGSYRQDYGAAGFLGFNIKDKIKLGYSYEFATDQVNNFGDGSHELQLVVRIGKKKFSRPEPKTEEQVQEPATEQEQQPAEQTEEVQKPPVEENQNEPAAPNVQPQNVQPQQRTQEQTQQPSPTGEQTQQPSRTEQPLQPSQQPAQRTEDTPAQNRQDTNVPPAAGEKEQVKSLDGNGLAPGHYVVVGAFHAVENAKNYARTLKRAGYPASVAYHPEKGYYLVHMVNAPTLDEARQLRDKYRQMSRYSFRDTWILSIE
jgi:type IX secretion system PorP/SprF family membrane protein